MHQITKTLKLKDFTWGELKRTLAKAGVKNEHKIHLIDIDRDSKHKLVLSLDEEVFLTNYSNI